MTVARELVTLLRYEIDDRNLKEYENRRPGTNVPGMPTPAVIERTNNGISRLGLLMRGLLAGVSAVSLARMADEWSAIRGRVSLVVDGINEQTRALTSLYDIAQRTRQAYTGTAQLFQAVQRNAKELELDLDQTLKLTETIGNAMTIGGGSAQAQEAALIQLGQALGTGTLRGEELNSIMEQAPRLAQAIAEAFGVSVGKLKELGGAGKLTSKQLAAGLLKQVEKLSAEFERMPLTFSGSWVKITNALGRQVDKLNQNTKAAQAFYKVTSLIVDNLEEILVLAAKLGLAYLFTRLSISMRALAAAGGVLAKAMAWVARGGARKFGFLLGTFIRMLAVVTALEYVFDDIRVWLSGGDSLLGSIIGQTSEWAWLVDIVKSGLTFIKDAMGQGSKTLGEWLSSWGLLGVIILGVVAAIGAIPALITAGIVAWASVFNFVRTNWDQIVLDFKTKIAQIGEWLTNLVPSGVRNFFGRFGAGSGGAPSTPFVGPGGAAFGITPSSMNSRPAAGVTQVVTNSPNVTVHATSSDPAAVADAAARGTVRGMGSAALPMVEAS